MRQADTQASPTRLVGLDIGGTATRFVCVDEDGAALAQLVKATPNHLGADAALALVFEGIEAVLEGGTATAIGIGASGPIDAFGVIRNPDTLPVFTGIDLVQALRSRYGVPCVIDNDAVTAAHGEYALGAARGFAGVLMVTLGTGVGVCMTQHGLPLRGADGQHPESGHMRVDGPPAPCYCGKSVCWEQLASRTALQRQAAALFPQTVGSESLQAARDAARSGNAGAKALFDAYGIAVAAGLVNLLTIYRPDAVVIGGAGAQYLGLFEKSLAADIAANVDVFPPFRIFAAALGDWGGAMGAAMLAKATLPPDELQPTHTPS
jgi:glucokinase